MIEGIDEAQALVKELLRLRTVGGNRVVKIAQSGHDRDRTDLHVRGMILRRYAQAQQSTAQQVRQNSHLVILQNSILKVRAPNH